MSTPFESAQLNLQLFDLRREPVLREARSWFLLDFNPETFAELVATISGPELSIPHGGWLLGHGRFISDHGCDRCGRFQGRGWRDFCHLQQDLPVSFQVAHREW